MRQLEYFVQAARAGSMAAAAEALHVSPAAVSLGIAELERGVGAEVFIRIRHRPLALTATGRHLLGPAVEVVGAADAFVAAVADESGAVGGTVRIGCFESLAPIVAPRVLRAAGDRHSDLVIEIIEGGSAELQSAVLEGRCDLALLYGLEIDDSLHIEELWSQRPYVIVPADHRLAGHRQVALRELADEPMILLDAPPSRFHSLGLLDRLGIDPTVARTVRSFETVRSLVAGGFGWAILVQRPASDVTVDGRRVVTIDIVDSVAAAPVVAVRVPTSNPSARVQACVELLAERR